VSVGGFIYNDQNYPHVLLSFHNGVKLLLAVHFVSIFSM